MGTDLHSPLGTNRKDKPSRRPPFGMGKLLLAVAVVGVAGLSLWAANSPSNLKQKQPEIQLAAGDDEAKADPADIKTADGADKPANQMDRSKPLTAPMWKRPPWTTAASLPNSRRASAIPMVLSSSTPMPTMVRIAASPACRMTTCWKTVPFGTPADCRADGERSGRSLCAALVGRARHPHRHRGRRPRPEPDRHPEGHQAIARRDHACLCRHRQQPAALDAGGPAQWP